MRSSSLLIALAVCVLGAALVAGQSTDPCYNACNAAASTCMNACMTTCPHADLGCIQTCDATCFTSAGVCIKACGESVKPTATAVVTKKPKKAIVAAVTAPAAAPVAAPKKDVPVLCLGECAVKTISCEKACKAAHKHFGCKAKCVLKAAECAALCEVTEKAPTAAVAAPAAPAAAKTHRLAAELEKRAPLAAFNKANAAAAAPIVAEAPLKAVPVVCLAKCAETTIACEKSCKARHKHFGCKAMCVVKAAECAAKCEVSEVAAVAAPKTLAMTEAQYQAEFTAFVRKFGKKYTHDEFFARYTIFKANINKIRAHAMTKSTYTMAVNEFADMTFTEFHSKMTGYKRKDTSVMRSKNGPHSTVKVADSVDWRAKGAVTPVKNQQQCGSCWAFSTTGSTEGAHAIKTGSLVSLSEQQLVDCSAAQGNQGCNGGMMDQGFQYIITNGGITTEAAYPYTAADGTCKTGLSTAATLSSFVDVTTGSEAALLQAVNIGPVSIAIEADQQCFQFYSGGVLSDPSCGTQLDHGVLVVGYGTDAATNTPYWIVKNSWGPSWGEAGYIRLIRGTNECGVAQEASYPVV